MRGTKEEGECSRRRLLVALVTAGIAGVAGCKGVEYPGASEDDEEPSPPGTAFSFAFDPDASNYTIAYDGESAFDEDNTDLLAIDHVTETGTADRMVWFGNGRRDPVSPGSTSTWGYDAERVTELEVVWAPRGAAGSGRSPEILARRSTL